MAAFFSIGDKGYIGLGANGLFQNDFYEYTPDSLCATNIKEENNFNKSMFVFPNPINNELNISSNDKVQKEIILYDVSSKKLLQQKFTNSISLNTEGLAKGIYIYEVRDKNGSFKKGKVVKD